MAADQPKRSKPARPTALRVTTKATRMGRQAGFSRGASRGAAATGVPAVTGRSVHRRRLMTGGYLFVA